MSLVALEPRTGTRTVPARGLTYHSPVTSSSSSSSEGEWIAQVADGDADAFARLYDAWSSRLFALILQIVVDRARARRSSRKSSSRCGARPAPSPRPGAAPVPG